MIFQHCPNRALTMIPHHSPHTSRRWIGQYRGTSTEGLTLLHRWERYRRTNRCRTTADWATLSTIQFRRVRASAWLTNQCNTAGDSLVMPPSNSQECSNSTKASMFLTTTKLARSVNRTKKFKWSQMRNLLAFSQQYNTRIKPFNQILNIEIYQSSLLCSPPPTRWPFNMSQCNRCTTMSSSKN